MPNTEMVRGGFDETLVHPLGIIAVFVLVLFVLFSDRKKAIAPLFIAAASIPMAQRLIVAGVDFTMLRILLLGYFARVVMRREYRSIRWNRLDTAMLGWCFSVSAVMLLAEPGLGILVNRLGWSFDMLGVYFLVRFLVRSWSDVKSAASALAVLSLPIAILFAFEWATAYNVFSIFGGVRAETWVRDGRLRCQGAFSHPILAGTFWAAALPLIWTLRKDKTFLMRLGTVCSLFIVAACSSSTPVLSVLVAVTGVALFPLRRHRTKMWIGLFVVLASVHVVMKAPVWHLMARADFTGGSTGWHRYRIFDAFVENFSEWYLVGEPDPLSWGVWEMRDVTNMYIAQGLNGGLLGLLAFLVVLVFAFGNVGRALNFGAIARSLKHQWICWCIGVAIFLHSVTFFGIGYFGQMKVMLYVELSLAACIYVFARRDSLKQRALKQKAKKTLLEAQRPRKEVLGVSYR